MTEILQSWTNRIFEIEHNGEVWRASITARLETRADGTPPARIYEAWIIGDNSGVLGHFFVDSGVQWVRDNGGGYDLALRQIKGCWIDYLCATWSSPDADKIKSFI